MGISKVLTISAKYLHLGIRTGAPRMLLRLEVDGVVAREFDAEIDPDEPEFLAAVDVDAFIGKPLNLLIESAPPKPLGSKPVELVVPATMELIEGVEQSDEMPANGVLYEERLRPQFHFSSKIGWNNDPNGLQYYDGEYHLFYQHNPFGWNHGNMHWGHAVSRDLVHWTEIDEALYPDELGTMFSGSGVVDHENSAGLQEGSEKTLVCIYTAAGGRYPLAKGHQFTQCIAYSTDRGRSWRKYTKNPVLQHMVGDNRDPKVIRHKPTGRWVMVLYLEENDYAVFTSDNLTEWERTCVLTIPGTSECPDIFELPVDGQGDRTFWVFWGAHGEYMLGSFDGGTFETVSGPHRFQYGRSYAAQTWSDVPESDGRRIQIAWLRGDKPGMPFNQQMSFPCKLTLRDTPEGVRMFSEPVRELETLHTARHLFDPGDGLAKTCGELLDIRLSIDLLEGSSDGGASIKVRGATIVFDRGAGTLALGDEAAPLPPIEGTLRLRVLVDRSSVEVFAQEGARTLSTATDPGDDTGGIEWRTTGSVRIREPIEAFDVKSIWP